MNVGIEGVSSIMFMLLLLLPPTSYDDQYYCYHGCYDYDGQDDQVLPRHA